MANKTQRNDPCPCGSAKKYKHCCLHKDREEQSALLAATAAMAAAEQRQIDVLTELDEDQLAQISNAVIALLKAGQLDHAETLARALTLGFPEVHDGYDRLGMVHQARGQNKQAADCYRQVIEFVPTHPDQYDPEFAATFHELVKELDPPAAG